MLLGIENITVHYGGALSLDNISLKIMKKEILTLIGSNGAGKTTILRTITGLKKLSSGKIWYQGRRIDNMPPQDVIRSGIAHVQQGRNLFPFMTILENLKMGAYFRNDKAGIKRDFEKVFALFPILKDRIHQIAVTMSGGEQQMLAIARGLMNNPRLLLLDEPSIGLAPIIVKEIGRIITDINHTGTSVLLVEQNAQMALRVAHRGYVFETGRIVLEGKCEDLQKDERIKRFYLGQPS